MLQSTLFLTFILSWQKISHVMCLSKQFIKRFNAIQYLILDYKDNSVYIYMEKRKRLKENFVYIKLMFPVFGYGRR